MKIATCFLALLASGSAARAQDTPAKAPPLPKPVKLDLWERGRAPIGDGMFEEANAFITVYRPAEKKANGAAAVICPGGGYGRLVAGPEGHGIAAWLTAHGITGIVLNYRLPEGRPEVPLLDAQRAIRTTRTHAEKWNLDPGRIGIMGFSAGGHLASTAATRFAEGRADAPDPVDRQSCRPDFAILVYPVITMGEKSHAGSRKNLLGAEPTPALLERYSNEKQVTSGTPPTFLAHAGDDKAVPAENSRLFHEALEEKEIPSKFLELESGGHGLNGYKGPNWEAWQKGALQWLASLKIIPKS